jgi:beta-lactam-binding protein with PASTA domain
MIENPRDRGYTGGLAAAPVFKAIAERIYATSGRFRAHQTDVRTDNGFPAVPDVTTLTLEAARPLLLPGGFEPNVRGSGTIVMRQSPLPGIRAPRRTVVQLTMSDESSHAGGPVAMPDVRGETIRRALTRLALLRLDVVIQGSGVVVSQDPQPREQMRVGTRVLIRCEPRNLSLVTAN